MARPARQRWLRGWLCCAWLMACSTNDPQPELHSITPAQVSNLVDTEVVAHGLHFYDDARVDLSSSAHTDVKRGWQVRLGNSIKLTHVTRADAKTLRFVIPAGTQAGGPYDVIATSPLGREARLRAALRVIDQPLGTLSIESAADGGGTSIGARSLAVGEALTLHAVLHANGGGLLPSPEVHWRVEGSVGAVDSALGTSTRFSSDAPGAAVVWAKSDRGLRAQTGRLQITLDPARAMDGSRLSIEDAANGGGALVLERDLSADDVLDLHATLRAADGTFMMEVAADWTLEGGITDQPAPSGTASWPLSPARPGVGRVGASFAGLFAHSGDLRVRAGRASTLEIVPSQAALIAGGSAVQFMVQGRDADGNLTGDLGAVNWTVLDGQLTRCDPSTGLFTPEHAGEGHLQAVTSLGLRTVSGLITVAAGHATHLTVLGAPTGVVHAGDPDITLTALATDRLGNPVGAAELLSWSVVGTPFGRFDPATGVLSPRTAGTASIKVTDSAGLVGLSDPITIVAGPLAALQPMPATAMLSTNDAPLQFDATGSDAFGNVVSALGTLSWSVSSGSLSTLSTAGLLDPIQAGSGTVRVASSLGPSATTGAITISSGSAKTLEIRPNTLTLALGDPPRTFSVVGKDARGNVTTDVGQITYSIASGTIAAIAPDTGVFTPTTAGNGMVRARSSYGPSVVSGTIQVGAIAQISALRVPDAVFATESQARIELDVSNNGVQELLTTGAYFSCNSAFNNDVTSDYTFRPADGNTDHIPPNTTVTLVFFVDVASNIYAGNVRITANADVFHPAQGLLSLSTSATTTAWSTSLGPDVTVTAPTPANSRLCVGASAAFGCSATGSSLPVYDWWLPGASPATSKLAAPSASFTRPGAFSYAVTVTDSWGLHNNALGATPIFVGEALAPAAQTYPTGVLVFSAPSTGQSIDMQTLPRSDLITMGAANDLVQCNGTPVDVSGDRYVTLFVDRGRIDPLADDHPLLPGIQVDLDQGNGHFASVNLQNDSQQLEGAATVYGEYHRPALGQVTAAGFSTVQFTHDTQPPSVVSSWPAADCGAGCYFKGAPFIFRFSEPMAPASVSKFTVERLSGTTCTSSVASTLTSSSSSTYDAASRTLFVYPATYQLLSGYTVRVTLGAQLTDTAATPNALSPLTRCAGVVSATTAVTPQVPSVSLLGPNPFSPDGDGSAESTQFRVGVDGATRFVRLAIRRGATEVWAHTEITATATDYTIVWDGRDSSGRVVGNGVYRFDVVATNLAGATAPGVTGTIEVQSAVHLTGVPARY